MKYLILLFFGILISCGKTIKDPSYQAIIRFENELSSEVRLVFYKNGAAAFDTLINSKKAFEIAENGLDGPDPRFFHDYDSARISQKENSKLDINDSRSGSGGISGDSLSVFNRNRYSTESAGKNKTRYIYKIGGQDSIRMK